MSYHSFTDHEHITADNMPPAEYAEMVRIIHTRSCYNWRPYHYYVYKLLCVLEDAQFNRAEQTSDIFPTRPFGIHVSEWLTKGQLYAKEEEGKEE